MRISDWSSDVCSSDLKDGGQQVNASPHAIGYSASVLSSSESFASFSASGSPSTSERMSSRSRSPSSSMLKPLCESRLASALSKNAGSSGAGLPSSSLCLAASTLPRFRAKTSKLESPPFFRSEEHTSELQSLMRISYAVFCLQKKKQQTITKTK